MTIDTNGVSLHPDEHAIAATPFNPDIVFIGNDGGVWRLNFHFSDSPFLFGYPGNEIGWDWIGDPGSLSGENMSFYIPVRTDPKVSGTWFFGAQHVWRTQDNGGDQSFLDARCNLFVGDLPFTGACGDWVAIGQDLSST